MEYKFKCSQATNKRVSLISANPKRNKPKIGLTYILIYILLAKGPFVFSPMIDLFIATAVFFYCLVDLFLLYLSS